VDFSFTPFFFLAVLFDQVQTSWILQFRLRAALFSVRTLAAGVVFLFSVIPTFTVTWS